jgi:hypothetical protein
VEYGVIYFEPVPLRADRCGWPRNLVGSVARKVRGVDSSNEAEDAASDAGWCRWSSDDISALIREALVPEALACNRYFDLGSTAVVCLRVLQALKTNRTFLGFHNPFNLSLSGDYTQYKKAPTFAVSCESLENHTYRKGAPL